MTQTLTRVLEELVNHSFPKKKKSLNHTYCAKVYKSKMDIDCSGGGGPGIKT